MKVQYWPYHLKFRHPFTISKGTKTHEDLEAKKVMIEKFAFTDPERYWHYLHHLLPQNPFLVCALDIAAWDIYGKLKKKKLYELWGGNILNNPICDYTIGIDTIEKMVAKMKELPWPIYKIKCSGKFTPKMGIFKP